jgi:hypothetical protein
MESASRDSGRMESFMARASRLCLMGPYLMEIGKRDDL